MRTSEYIKFYRSARMLQAEFSILDIQSTSFPHYKESDRTVVMRDLKRASVVNLFKPVADAADFAAKFAQKMMGR